LRQYLLQNDGAVVTFAPGNYRYTNFQWLQGVRNVTLIGTGSVGLRNVAASPWDMRKVTLMANADMLTGPQSIPNMGYAAIYPFFTANSGGRSLRLLSPNPFPEVGPGTDLLIFGYNQQDGGWPPNLRYSEFATVRDIDTNGGRISLQAPLKHSYQDDWPAQPSTGYGPAALVPLQRQGSESFQLAESRVFENITFLANPNGPAYTNQGDLGGLYTQGVRFVELRNCNMYFFGPNENERVRVSNCNIGTTELGKVVGGVEILDSTVGGVGEATGVELLVIRRSTITGGFSVAPRGLILTDNTIMSSTFYQVGAAQEGFQIGLGTLSNTHVDTAYIANNTLVTPSGPPLVAMVNVSRGTAVTPVEGSDTGVVIPTNWAWLGTASVGAGLYPPAGPSATIQAIRASGPNTEVDTSGPSLAGATGALNVKCVTRLVLFGNTIVGTPPAQLLWDATAPEELITDAMTEAEAFNSGSRY